MRTIQRDIVGVIIFSKDNKIWLALKAKEAVYAGCWAIPGGGIEGAETQIQAAVRETKEEAGIDISKYKISLINDTHSGESEKTLKELAEVWALM